MKADAAIKFDIILDLGKIKTAVSDASAKVKSEFEGAFRTSAKNCQETCNRMADSFKKVDSAADETRQKINAILNDNERSAKSKASSIAWIYRKQGMSQSEAMKKAWSEIERESSTSTQKIKKDIKGIGEQSKITAGNMGGTLLPALKKIGLALAAAFSVKKLVDFAAQCIELGSDLQEVQNVVDVTFPRMSSQVDAFAKEAAASFGLSETMAKRFTGTFGAMAKAFGFSEKAAYEMSTTLTGLAGDVASFYNISQDEAYTKLKSVFSGETETLKDLGVVMTQNALDAYALANGYGKTTQAMSEMEKVALRYQFVQDQLSASSGDFIRTSDSWANQVRILKLQFDSLKATIGQGLINVLTPVIKVINTIIGKLMSLANAFRSFTEMITGKKSSGGGASVAAAGMDNVAASADNAGAAMGGAGSAAKKAAKDIATATTGIDELNILNPETGSEESGSGGSGGYAADEFDMGELATEQLDEADNRLQGLIDRLTELRDLFIDGFKAGLGDVTLEPLQEAIEGIKASLQEIFTDPGVVEAFNRCLDKMVYSAGQVAGAMTSIGITIATNLLGGLNRYLAENTDRIKEYLISCFDITGEIAEIQGNFAQAVANIFSVFGGENGQRVTAAIIGIFADAFMGVNETCLKLSRDLVDVITRPFIDNQDAFKTAIDGFLGFLASALETVKGVVDETMANLGEMYDAHVKPMFDALASGLSSIVSVLLTTYQGHIQPILDGLAERLSSFASQYLQPLIDKGLELIGKVADAVTLLWVNILQPFIEWFVSTIIPAITPVLQGIIDSFFLVGETISSILSGIITWMGGIIDFLVGVFTGEWSLAWTGIQEILSGIWEIIKSIVTGALSLIENAISLAWTRISVTTTTIWNTIKTLINTIWTGIKSLAVTLFNNIKDAISLAWTTVQTVTTQIWNGIQETLSLAWETVKSTAELAFTGVKDTVIDAWNALKDKTGEIWDGIWNTIKGAINNIISGVESMVNGVVDGINTMINGLNGLIDNIPGVSGSVIPNMGTVSLPRLAQGGFVRANTPQLAMIGDNRHQGEVVAPEDKLQEMVNRAVDMASKDRGMSDYYLEAMVDLLQKVIDLIEQMDLTVTIDIRDIKKKLVELDKRSGYTVRTT